MQPPERSYFLHDIIADNVRWAGNRPALIFADRNYTWSEFFDQVRGLMRGLTRHGVTRGSRVSVLDRNSERYVFLHYALASLGAVICPINMWLRAGEISYILDRLRPFLVVTSNEFRELAAEASTGLSTRPRFVTYGSPRENDVPWETLSDGPASDVMSAPASWDDPHMILFTSGTTGQPKGAVISHKRSIIDGMSASVAFGVRRGDRLFEYAPLFHTGSWDYLKLMFMNQGSAVLVDRFDGDEAVNLIDRHGCNLMFAYPLVLRKMMESPSWPRANLSSMRTLAFGNFDSGSFLETALTEFRRRGAEHIQALFPYGLTEAGPFVTITRPYDTSTHLNALGTPLPGVSVALFDDSGSEVPRGSVGEICVRSPALMTGYLDMPEATAEAFKDGWLHTGDLGRMDDQGFLYMIDRKKDMVRTAGENVYAREVEQLLMTHPDIAEVAVVGLPDSDYGEMVVAVVVARPGRQPQGPEIIEFSRARLAGFKSPRRVVFVESFPRTVTGKIAKNEVKSALLAASQQP